MSENRRSSGAPRSRRPSRPKSYRQEERPAEREINENNDDRAIEQDDEREEEVSSTSAQRNDRDRGYRDQESYEEDGQEAMLSGDPRDSQPAYLGKSSDVESQPSDQYMIETHFDAGIGQFSGSILEFPGLRAEGQNREVVMADLEAQLGQKLEALRQANGVPPAPICEKQYPELLQVRLSQSLMGRLDRISRFEKLPIEKLVEELVARALERKTESRESHGSHQQSHHRHSRHHRPQNRRGGHQHRGGARGNYHETMQSRDNFMEYVRNLESRDSSGNWRKK